MSVRIERAAPVWTVVLDRPAACNAVDGPTAAALAAAFREFEADESALVAVLGGAGGTFCAGADLKAMSNRLDPDTSSDGPMGPSRLALSKPVIAAISGHAVAGGLELACWCDLRVMEADAVLGVFCRRWGVPLIDGGTVRLPRIVGLGRALDLMTMELAAAGRPFLYVPLRNHFEQNRHVRHRLDNYRAGICVPWEDATPDHLAALVAAHIHDKPTYRPVEQDGADRAAALLAELL